MTGIIKNRAARKSAETDVAELVLASMLNRWVDKRAHEKGLREHYEPLLKSLRDRLANAEQAAAPDVTEYAQLKAEIKRVRADYLAQLAAIQQNLY